MTQKTLFSSNLTLEEAKELIKNGADVNEIDMYGATPLFQVSNIDIARLLIQNNANVNHLLTFSGETPLFYANNIEIVELLIKYGVLNCP